VPQLAADVQSGSVVETKEYDFGTQGQPRRGLTLNVERRAWEDCTGCLLNFPSPSLSLAHAVRLTVPIALKSTIPNIDSYDPQHGAAPLMLLLPLHRRSEEEDVRGDEEGRAKHYRAVGAH
jgi:hypothetical protein